MIWNAKVLFSHLSRRSSNTTAAFERVNGRDVTMVPTQMKTEMRNVADLPALYADDAVGVAGAGDVEVLRRSSAEATIDYGCGSGGQRR